MPPYTRIDRVKALAASVLDHCISISICTAGEENDEPGDGRGGPEDVES